MKVKLPFYLFEEYKRIYMDLTECEINCHKDIVQKRLERFFSKFGINGENITLAETKIKTKREYADAFIQAFIPVESYFFREKDYLELALDLACETKSPKKILVIPCASGEEVYSLKILAEKKGIKKITFEGTDISPKAVEKAEQGIYPKHSLENIPSHLKKQYFEKQDSFYKAKNTIKQGTAFFQSNIIKSTITNKYDIILCRNLFMYFEKETINKGFKKIAKMLKKEGILILGKSELSLLRNSDIFDRLSRNKLVYFRKKQ